jgi:serine protease
VQIVKRFFVPTVLTISMIVALFAGVPSVANATVRPVNPEISAKSVGVIVTYKPGFEPIAPNGETTGENFSGVELAAPRDLGRGYKALKFETSLTNAQAQKVLLGLQHDPRIETVQLDAQLQFSAASAGASTRDSATAASIIRPFEALKPASAPTAVKGINYFDSKAPRSPRIRLSWKAPTTLNKAKITGYRIEQSSDKKVWKSLIINTGKTSTAVSITSGITIGKSAYYRVRALTALGASRAASAASTAVSVTPKVAPAAPFLVNTVVAKGQAPTWEEQSLVQRGGLTVTYEAVATSDGQEVDSCTTAATSCQFSKLQAGYHYTVHVIARNSLGQASSVFVPDPYFSSQWHLYTEYSIHADYAWRYTKGKSSVVVAVLDGGITAHPDLNANIVDGYDFISDPAYSRDGDGWDANPQDEGDHTNNAASTWHGTHVAGIIGARSNSIGGVGVAPGVKIQPIRVLGTNGGSSSDLIAAIHWAAGIKVAGVPANPTPARVINLSIGTSTPTSCDAGTQAAVRAAWDRGVTPITAAGNSAFEASGSYPGNCYPTINVTATGITGDIAPYANFGDGVDFSAPGGDAELSALSPDGSEGMIVSTFNLGETTEGEPSYGLQEGTSMAAPVVAGVVALIYSVRPDLGSLDVYKILLATVGDFKEGSYCAITATPRTEQDPRPSYCGKGIVDAGRAVQYAVSYKKSG